MEVNSSLPVSENTDPEITDRNRENLTLTGVPLTQSKQVLHCGYVQSIAISPVDNDLIATCGGAEFILWNVKTNTILIREQTHDSTKQVDFSFDGTYASTSGKKLFVFDINNRCLKWKDDTDRFNGLIWHPKKHRLYFYDERFICMSEIPLKTAELFKEEDERIYQLTVSRNGTFLISASAYCKVRVFNVSTNALLYTIEEPNSGIYDIYKICTNIAESLAIIQFYGYLKVLSLTCGRLRAVFANLESIPIGQAGYAGFSADEYVFATASRDGCLFLFDLSTFAMKMYRFDVDVFGSTVVFDYFDKYLNIGKDNVIRLFDPKSRKIVGRYQPQVHAEYRLLISRDNKRFISRAADGTVDVFDLE